MKKIIFTVLLWLSVADCQAYEYIFCNSCTQKIEFVNFAKGRFGTGSFPKDYQVINYNTEEIWNVHVEREFEPDPNYNFIYAIASVPNQKDIDDFIEIKDFFVQKDIFVMIPAGSDQDSFGVTRSEVVNGYITGHPLFPTLIKKVNLINAIKIAFGFGKTFAIVVFSNGDVAKYEITDFRGGTGCCKYLSNSARDIDGDIITSNGGNGGSGGSGDYVQPNNGGLTITLGGASTPRFFCWKIPTGVECRRL